jgi:hypothetical protein
MSRADGWSLAPETREGKRTRQAQVIVPAGLDLSVDGLTASGPWTEVVSIHRSVSSLCIALPYCLDTVHTLPFPFLLWLSFL